MKDEEISNILKDILVTLEKALKRRDRLIYFAIFSFAITTIFFQKFRQNDVYSYSFIGVFVICGIFLLYKGTNVELCSITYALSMYSECFPVGTPERLMADQLLSKESDRGAARLGKKLGIKGIKEIGLDIFPFYNQKSALTSGNRVQKLIRNKIPNFRSFHTLKRSDHWGRHIADIYIDVDLRKFALVEEEAFGLIIKSVECYSGADIEECEVIIETGETKKSSPNIAAAAIGGLMYGLPGDIIASQLKRDKHYIKEPQRIFLGLKIKGSTPKVWRRYFWSLDVDKKALWFDRSLQEAQDWKRLVDSIRLSTQTPQL